MKRITATVMVIWMALTAMQPALGFHFCGGALVSVGLAETGRCCCGQETGEDAGCPAPSDGIARPVESCCSGYTVALSTGEFRTTPDACCGKEPPAAGTVLFAAGWSGCNARNDAPPIQRLSPPGTPAASSADLLALICTLRI